MIFYYKKIKFKKIRKSIAGLAIAAVLVFHLNITGFSAGFIGVDMWLAILNVD